MKFVFSVGVVGVVLDKTVLLGDAMVVVAAGVSTGDDDMQSGALGKRSLADLLTRKTRTEASSFQTSAFVCGDGNGEQQRC